MKISMLSSRILDLRFAWLTIVFMNILFVVVYLQYSEFTNNRLYDFIGFEPIDQRFVNEHVFLNKSYPQNYVEISYETNVKCVGSHGNYSCLYRNLYYHAGRFIAITLNGSIFQVQPVRLNAFTHETTVPTRMYFDTLERLEQFVRQDIDPLRFPSVTVYFSQFWHSNIGHALFDGLYPAYLSLMQFAPRHLNPFRLLAQLDHCTNCWSEHVYARFAGLGLMKRSSLDKISKKQWFLFDEIVFSNGLYCQRCITKDFRLAGAVEFDALRLFRDRMYRQHGLLPPISRTKHAAEFRMPEDILFAFVIDNKRFTGIDREQIRAGMRQLNEYTDRQLKWIAENKSRTHWPLVRVLYLDYRFVKHADMLWINTSEVDNEFQFIKDQIQETDFMAQLKLLRRMDIHISGPGTGQMYQSFLPDGSVHVNLGGIRPVGADFSQAGYTSYLEQYITSATTYVKGLYYPINERMKGIKKEQFVTLIRQAALSIRNGFSLPVNPRDNLAQDGQLFIEMCATDSQFCSLVTVRSSDKPTICLDFWIEDLVHEQQQWNINGTLKSGRTTACPYNRTILRQLRQKFKIFHRDS